MNIVAASRPTGWDFPLFVHVLGAMILVGGLVAAASALGYARGDARFLRLGYWSLLAVSLPGWVVMRVGAEWIRTKEGWNDLPSSIDQPSWLDIGSFVADLGGLILVVSLIAGGVGIRQLRDGKGPGCSGRPSCCRSSSWRRT